MKHHKQQTKAGQCGAYNLANALCDANIYDYADNPEFVPCGSQEINKILKKENYNFRIEPLIGSVDWKTKIPMEFGIESIETLIDKHMLQKEETILALEVVIQIAEGPKGLHAVTLFEYKGRLAYSDPREERFRRIGSVAEVFIQCKYVNAINCFCTEEGYVALNPCGFDLSVFASNLNNPITC